MPKVLYDSTTRAVGEGSQSMGGRGGRRVLQANCREMREIREIQELKEIPRGAERCLISLISFISLISLPFTARPRTAGSFRRPCRFPTHPRQGGSWWPR